MNKYSAFCLLCKKTFSVSGSGISQVKPHAGTEKHLGRSKDLEGQSTFRKSSDNVVELTSSKIIFPPGEEVHRAEILHALKVVDSNQSFASADGDGERFVAMFPDSKMKYTIQYGIAPYFKELLKDDLKNTAYSFKFDETTNQQVKKQYDGYVQYWSCKHKCINIAYCGTLMVDHCPSEKLLEHFFEFIEKAELDISFLLHLGMDGPNVNLKFERSIKSSNVFSNIDKMILSVGTCPLHIVHNSFRNGIKVLEFDMSISFSNFLLVEELTILV